ncbi:hypothetical protein D3877_03860 [Azospirillum cavernae]|uniref:Lysozyme inhibitor LprI N-terminal domain-containing protein n=1 Tax=Azospirillum cavernae TaxID=2320860 RepID=A0A418W1D6_9PROT|nr:hypothetical protein [Azospirillum cavernae]RJF83778.1 hypothetical protein D3877_03860 [Azospirillum cavernae]
MWSVLLGSVGGLLAGFLAVAPALAADDCAAADTPMAQLICRDAALSQAASGLDGAVAALGETTDANGRLAIDAQQTLWLSRRNEICPVAPGDLTDAKATKARTECLARSFSTRTAQIEAQRAARGKPVADLPLSITDAAAPRLVPVQARPATLTRPVSVNALVGRWAKADPISRAAIDDCRSSYLEVTREQTANLVDPRIPGFPVEGRLAATGEFSKGVNVIDGNGNILALVRLDAAETPRLDRLTVQMAPPSTFAASFVRCR